MAKRDWLIWTDWSSIPDGLDFHLLHLSIKDTSILQRFGPSYLYVGKSRSEDIGVMGHTRLDLGPKDQCV